ncbi:MAG: cobalt transporter ATP-binding subunit [Desulfotomaculum sp. BICA1-6]|nr:MAG: cobalt transporter ATP-binding subunit [Desulfotomaculum sp. BICA1-6]
MPGSNDYLIQFEHVSFAYPGGGSVIHDFSAGVRRGEFIALIGPNGSGKSTLAGLAAGALRPAAGWVRVDGMDTADPSVMGAIRRRVGLVLQNPDNQLVAARVEEDVAFGPENLNLPSPEVRRRVEYAIAAVGLDRLRDRPPHLLSGGEKQRLAIAGLLALEPSCLVLDEPTSMLDPRGRREVLGVLKNLVAKGTTVLQVTHHMGEAAEAGRVWVLAEGKLQADASPGTVFSRPELLQRLGLTLPPAAELAGCLAARDINVPAGIVNLEDMVHFLCRALK